MKKIILMVTLSLWVLVSVFAQEVKYESFTEEQLILTTKEIVVDNSKNTEDAYIFIYFNDRPEKGAEWVVYDKDGKTVKETYKDSFWVRDTAFRKDKYTIPAGFKGNVIITYIDRNNSVFLGPTYKYCWTNFGKGPESVDVIIFDKNGKGTAK